MNPVRVLFVSGGSLDYGGIASWMLSYAAEFDRNLVAVDFLVHGLEPGAREQDALSLGAKVYHVPYRGKQPLANRRGIERAIAGGYDIVHAHMEGMNGYSLKIAKDMGVRACVSHAHSVDYLTSSALHKFANNFARRKIPKYATDLFACSEAAGKFLYGEELIQKDAVKMVRNAIKTDYYRFDEKARTRIRRELKLEDRFVIGCVARLNDRVKNQTLLLNMLQLAKSRRTDLTLVLVGDGPDHEMLNRRILEQGLEGNVLLTGERCDVPALLSAFDLFVLPSWFEGLGIALIEAQANGLPCYASDRIPRDTNVISCEPLPPDRADLWAERMIYAKPASSRELNRNAFISKGYDIESAASTLMNEYLEISKR